MRKKCLFDPNHEVDQHGYYKHLIECKSSIKKDWRQCRYDSRHWRLLREIKVHEEYQCQSNPLFLKDPDEFARRRAKAIEGAKQRYLKNKEQKSGKGIYNEKIQQQLKNLGSRERSQLQQESFALNLGFNQVKDSFLSKSKFDLDISAIPSSGKDKNVSGISEQSGLSFSELLFEKKSIQESKGEEAKKEKESKKQGKNSRKKNEKKFNQKEGREVSEVDLSFSQLNLSKDKKSVEAKRDQDSSPRLWKEPDFEEFYQQYLRSKQNFQKKEDSRESLGPSSGSESNSSSSSSDDSSSSSKTN